MSIKFANNAYGTLLSSISASSTTIVLDNGQGARFPSLASGEHFYATLVDVNNNLEIVKVTARSSDSMTVERGQDHTMARAFAIGDRVELRPVAAGLVDMVSPYDKNTLSTGSFALPSGTTAQRPLAANLKGHIRYNTDDSKVCFSNGIEWLPIFEANVALNAMINSTRGEIFAGSSSRLTLMGGNFLLNNLVVNFFNDSRSINVSTNATIISNVEAEVIVPYSVHSKVVKNDVIKITATNLFGFTSTPIEKAVIALPSGGTITNSNGYRYHKFTSSGTFVNTFSTNADILIVAGGGGTKKYTWGRYAYASAGAGAGGVIQLDNYPIYKQNYNLIVGAGGSFGVNGLNSSGFGNVALGGGTSTTTSWGAAGGSGGGGSGNRQSDSGTSRSRTGAYETEETEALTWFSSTGNHAHGGSGLCGQGNAGGNGYLTLGGGGGGAGCFGATARSIHSIGHGGVGINWKNLGVFYGNGGGGGCMHNTFISRGGIDGSGLGGNNIRHSEPGAQNTGSGGGGTSSSNRSDNGSQGGSGVIIIRYKLEG